MTSPHVPPSDEPFHRPEVVEPIVHKVEGAANRVEEVVDKLNGETEKLKNGTELEKRVAKLEKLVESLWGEVWSGLSDNPGLKVKVTHLQENYAALMNAHNESVLHLGRELEKLRARVEALEE